MHLVFVSTQMARFTQMVTYTITLTNAMPIAIIVVLFAR
ncbi:MAG: hypothetical protein IKV30_07080 [Clostridia bacterium]|nr:hypothetical protein [Clostridia bacterium]